ncbi:DUF3604 domain-containing protein [Leisingera sp. NJS204]|uniref:DUF3604 domain-containing protein n=1 Tax=Leisingera sp. NJS204 TaxID=2508307 RepID=UPI001010461F|nr:DUF3604 domain-containing protein [Leisingera sp. NJS204]QAX30761.1 DUF3604 domain-containing protein [Leisingera sp. NJS204]
MRTILTVGTCVLALSTPVFGQDTHLYWGDTHLHTNYSLDAYALQNETVDPETAYRFAKGLPVIAGLTGQRAQLETPLDFLVVSDHAEFLGVIRAIGLGDPKMMAIEGGRRWNKMLNEGKGKQVFFEIIQTANKDVNALIALNSKEVRATAWEAIVNAAERHNDPGRFTTFIGWEWSSQPGGRNLHRVVFTPDGKDKAMGYLPYGMIDSAKPRDLWNWLAETAEREDTDFISIPHNMNLSQGTMFPLTDESGNPIDEDYAEQRERWETVAEVTQVKGDSETHPDLSPDDPFAYFEIYDRSITVEGGSAKIEAGSYARSALMRGLTLENAIGKNPYKFGMIGSTDAHTGLSTPDEGNFLGKFTADSIPGTKMKETLPNTVGWEMAAQGLAGVWATENTRAAIAAAFRRKEVYATTGPRIALRVFGGYKFPADATEAVDLAAVGYAHGIPMGGDLARPEGDSAPSLLIHAVKDPLGANLDRVQVVKGWLGTDGKTHETIYDVVLSDGRTDGSVDVGDTIDPETGSYTNDIGAPEFVTLWTDPDFAPGLRAFYYVRVLQIPTPRHSLYNAIALQIDPAETGRPPVIRERAYSSPIWYSPGDDLRTEVPVLVPAGSD